VDVGVADSRGVKLDEDVVGAWSARLVDAVRLRWFEATWFRHGDVFDCEREVWSFIDHDARFACFGYCAVSVCLRHLDYGWT